MRYLITLLVVATITLLTGLGIRMHADWRLTNKLFYHTVDSTLYEYDEVFAERNLGDQLQLWSVVALAAGGIVFVAVKINHDRKG